jgi:hypothetical protein
VGSVTPIHATSEITGAARIPPIMAMFESTVKTQWRYVGLDRRLIITISRISNADQMRQVRID